MKIENLTPEQKNLPDEINTTKTYIGKSDLTSGNAYRVTLTRNGKKSALYLMTISIMRAIKTTLSSRFCVIVRRMNIATTSPTL